MAGMKRFVTYIYSYENRSKGANAGFAKFEIRGGECRIEIHLRGFIGRTTCKIYLFRLERRDMEGFEIGELGIMNGAGDFRILLPAERICTSPYGVFDMEGLVIFSEDDRMFLSRWTEGESFEAAKENFRVWKPAVELQPEPVDSAAKESKAADSAEKEPKAADSAEKEPKAADSAEKEPEAPAVEPQSEPAKAEAPAVEPQPMPVTEHKDPVENVTATELPMQNIFPQYTWQEIWENLQAGHPRYQPFENTDIQCLRIELKDLRELPRRYWYLGNNSFLLHGFFNYRYLILGKEKNHYFIGIPGIFQRQEHVMATIFGFPEFLPTMLNKKEKEHAEWNNRFGFWFRYMEE